MHACAGRYIIPGGSAGHFHREGYTFDVGSSMMFGFGEHGTTNLITRALAAVGKKLDTVPDPTQIHYHLPKSEAHPEVRSPCQGGLPCGHALCRAPGRIPIQGPGFAQAFSNLQQALVPTLFLQSGKRVRGSVLPGPCLEVARYPDAQQGLQLSSSLLQGLEVKVWRSYEDFVEELAARFPHERRGIERFYGECWAVFNALNSLELKSLEEPRYLLGGGHLFHMFCRRRLRCHICRMHTTHRTCNVTQI